MPLVDRESGPTLGAERAPLVLPFSAIGEAHQAEVGGKAWSLAALTAAGFRVPDGFVITAAALEQVLAGPALVEARRALDEAGAGATLDDQRLAAIREQILGAGLPPALREALRAAARSFLADRVPLAVRSSGSKEDLDDASFAGQYDTFLNVRGETALELAVKGCWASLWQPRVLEYARGRAGGAGGLTMAVVVQRMVAAEVAGVMFTVNPVTGREREIVVEAAFGLGESLVSGRVNADHFVLDAHTGQVISREIAEKALKIVPAPEGDGGTREVALAGDEARQPTLDDARLAELAELGSAIQEHYGRPMDIEWALLGGELHVLQARAVTRISFAPDAGEWTTADFKDGGVSSDVCSPFMWSLYELALENSMPRYFKSIRLLARADTTKFGRMFFARPYWNLGKVKEVLEAVPGFVERNFDTDLGITPSYEGPGRTTPTTAVGVARALPVLFALKRSYTEVLAHDRRLVVGFDERKRPYDLDEPALAALDRNTFAAKYRALITELYYETETGYFTTIYNTSNSKLDFKVHFERANRAVGGDLDYLALMGGLRDLSHMRPLKDLHELAGRLARAGRGVDEESVRGYALRWRHHGQKELDIRVPRWKDDLVFVRQVLEQAVAAHEGARDPVEQAEAQHAAYERERHRALFALRRHPFARRSFVKMLDLVRSYAWWREEMRDRSSYAYYLVRIWSVEAARRLIAESKLAEPDDVWYLPFQEVLALIAGELGVDEARARVRAGRRMVRSFRNFANPNEIGAQYREHGGPAPALEAGALHGTGCSPGRYEGRARVLRKLDEMHRVEKGDVLITVFTDPGWTPLFARLGAVVTETGGMLAHAAVISREYGIPAVLAVPRATALIPDGAQVRIDGGRGTIEILD